MLHFVIPSSYCDELALLPDRHLESDYPYWLGGRFNWAAQSWLVLRQYREGMTVGTAPEPGRVNFGHVMTWRGYMTREGEFRVSVRADYRRLFDVDFEILQNPAVPLESNQAYLPYWPVPGILPRNPSRRGLRTIAYAGRIGPLNIASELLHGRETLLPDLELRIIPPHRWHDLSEIDAMLAVRTLDTAAHDAKPPSKLFLAWHANVPLVAGYDSAFSAVGRPGEEYLRVASWEQLRATLRRLHDDPAFYEAIVENGRRKVHATSREAIAEEWLRVLDDQVVPHFESWRETPLRVVRQSAARCADRGREAISKVKRMLVPPHR
jgi:hypothetical protein